MLELRRLAFHMLTLFMQHRQQQQRGTVVGDLASLGGVLMESTSNGQLDMILSPNITPTEPLLSDQTDPMDSMPSLN